MIPILYEKTETAFTSNGLGRLSSCISCLVTEERNGIYECQFEFPVSDPMFEQIQEGRIIACTHDEQGDIQPFDIYGRSEPINGVVTFYAHHISYRLNEIVTKPFEASSCVDALVKIKTNSIGSNPFTFWTNKSVTAEYMSATPRQIRNMLGGEENSILDVFGTGEYEFDKFGVKLYLHRGQDTNVSIRYGKNLIDFTNEYDASEAYTAVVPYWLGEVEEGEETVETLVMLPELFISSGHSVPSGREVVVPLDLSESFGEAPTVEQLRSVATSRLANSYAWLPNQTVTVDFVQLWQTDEYADYAVLQRLSLCDTCGVFVPMYGISLRAKVIRVVYNVLLDRYDEMELGDKPTTYTAVIEKMYNSKVAGIVEGLKTVNVDIRTVAQNLAEAVLEINADIADLQDQIDGNITTWFFDTDPSMSAPPVTYDPNVEGSGWDTDAKKKEHLGDLYYNRITGKAWRFVEDNGVFSWNEVVDSGVAEALRIASEAKDTADTKRRVFYTTPVPPYDEGDLWVQGDNPTTGDILRCATPKAADETYDRSDWVKASKYTDDSAFEDWKDNDFLTIINGIENQVDAKIETWAQTANPATAWTTIETKKAHEGDLWLYTGLTAITVYGETIKPQGTYKFHYVEAGSLANESGVELADENGSVIEANESLTWESYSSTATNIFDLADGKSTIYYGSPTGSYSGVAEGDYLVDSSNGNTYRYRGGAWVKVTDYQTYTNNAVASAKSTIESQYEQAIENATELIRGGTGGYVVTTVNANGQPIELLITDNMDLNQAVNVWRWNQGGLAHSHTGYNGPFNDVAITADGKINASRILTGALTANLITAGTISSVDGLNTWNLESGQLVAKKGSIGGYTITSSTIEHLSGSSNQNYTRLNADGLSLKYSGSSGVYTYLLYTGQDGLRIQFQPTNRGNVDAPQIAPNYIKNDRNNLYYAEATISSLNAIRLGSYSKNIRGQNPLTVFVTEPAFIGGDSATPVSESVLIQDGLYVLGTLEVNGTKNRVVKTDNYSHRLLYCYETPTPLFGDIGEAQLDADGFCYIDLDDIFTETIAEQVEYQVFLQKEGEGDCWVSDKQQRYFVIQGTPNLKVAWELKAKQKDYHNLRLEQSGRYLDEYERTEDDFISLDNYINEQEELLYG